MASFRKRIKIAPGINLNVSKSGVSSSIGGKGFSVTTGKKGTYVNTSIPGTGIYDRKKISGSISNSSSEDRVSSFGCALFIVFAMAIVLILIITAIVE